MVDKFSVSIVLFDTPIAEISTVYDSVVKSSNSVNIYIVDNSKISILNPADFPLAKCIHNPNNPGYGAAHNQAIKLAISEGSKWHFAINPDISFEPDTLSKLIAHLAQNPDIGIAVPRIISKTGTEQTLCKLLPTPCNLIMRRFFYWLAPSFFDAMNARYELRFWNYREIADIPSLSGCFMAFNLAHVQNAGLFDERFFLYMEDIDLCRRVGMIARTVHYPYATVTHTHSKASFKSLNMTLIHMRSAFYYFNKWGWFFDSYRSRVNSQTVARLSQKTEFKAN